MRTNRDNVNKILEDLIRKNSDRKSQDKIIEKLKKRGFQQSEIRDVLDGRIEFKMLDDVVLYWYLKTIYEMTENEKSNPVAYFTENEILIANKYERQQDDTILKYPLIFNDVIQIAEDQWLTKLTIKQITDLYRSGLIIYNPKTQRKLKIRKQGNQIIESINVNPVSVNEIAEAIENDDYIPNELTFNIEKTGEESFNYNHDKYMFTMFFGVIAVNDGYNRSTSIVKLIRKIPDKDFTFEIRITNHDEYKSNKFIVQQNKRNEMSKIYLQDIDPDKKSNKIVDNLNSSRSYLKGTIAKDIKTDKAYIVYNELSTLIDLLFKPKELKDVAKISNYLIKSVNLIMDNKIELFDEKESIIIYGIITLLSGLYNENFSIEYENVEDVISKIDFNYLRELKYTKVSNKLVKNLIKGVNLQCVN